MTECKPKIVPSSTLEEGNGSVELTAGEEIIAVDKYNHSMEGPAPKRVTIYSNPGVRQGRKTARNAPEISFPSERITMSDDVGGGLGQINDSLVSPNGNEGSGIVQEKETDYGYYQDDGTWVKPLVNPRSDVNCFKCPFLITKSTAHMNELNKNAINHVIGHDRSIKPFKCSNCGETFQKKAMCQRTHPASSEGKKRGCTGNLEIIQTHRLSQRLRQLLMQCFPAVDWEQRIPPGKTTVMGLRL
jgi:hypothetical protein